VGGEAKASDDLAEAVAHQDLRDLAQPVDITDRSQD